MRLVKLPIPQLVRIFDIRNEIGIKALGDLLGKALHIISIGAMGHRKPWISANLIGQIDHHFKRHAAPRIADVANLWTISPCLKRGAVGFHPCHKADHPPVFDNIDPRWIERHP